MTAYRETNTDPRFKLKNIVSESAIRIITGVIKVCEMPPKAGGKIYHT